MRSTPSNRTNLYDVISAFVSGGLVWLYFNREAYNWNPPIKATLPVTVFFLLSNIYLVIAPYIPPENGQNVYESLPYYLHCLVGTGVLLAGSFYWVVWSKVLPWLGGYTLKKEIVVGEDGWTRNVFVHVKKDE